MPLLTELERNLFSGFYKYAAPLALSDWAKASAFREHLADAKGRRDFQSGVFPSLPLLPSVKILDSPTNSAECQVQVFAMSRRRRS